MSMRTDEPGVARAKISHLRDPRGGAINKDKLETELVLVTVPDAADSSIRKVVSE